MPIWKQHISKRGFPFSIKEIYLLWKIAEFAILISIKKNLKLIRSESMICINFFAGFPEQRTCLCWRSQCWLSHTRAREEKGNRFSGKKKLKTISLGKEKPFRKQVKGAQRKGFVRKKRENVWSFRGTGIPNLSGGPETGCHLDQLTTLARNKRRTTRTLSNKLQHSGLVRNYV